ncbi:lytic transglycosylase domain-containing protein [Dyadobacter sp. CY345]|uniref:lytic transglycosylase domain-containing protein n=1 Tax=Dyadobacter sp. CY345 TaxID=2909335 RepID=UPI001F18EFD0|nr:lytic transglycosylase domain-containing protein [Dyadobacter sp. CY345]MCF2444451.1 lytic transglycosylase domain-containing protein [Dyadobacter sp. CY345]
MIRIIFIAFSIASMGMFSLSNLKVEKKELKSELTINSNLLAINFCGEKVPLSEMRIAERYQKMIRNYDTYAFRKLMTSAEKRMKVIEPILKKYGVPSDFKYIPIIESAMSNQATSHRGAGGYWQLMPATAKSLGLTVNGTVDDRRHLVKSTHAAGKYLKDLHRQLGSWTLVAAAYNAGPQHIQNRMSSQNKDDYFKLRLNSETTKYIYKIIAVKEWFSNPERSREWGSGDVLEKMAQIREEKKLSELSSDSKQLARAATDS